MLLLLNAQSLKGSTHTPPLQGPPPFSQHFLAPSHSPSPQVRRCSSLLLMRCSRCLAEGTLTKSSRTTHAGTLSQNPQIFNASSKYRVEAATMSSKKGEKTAWDTWILRLVSSLLLSIQHEGSFSALPCPNSVFSILFYQSLLTPLLSLNTTALH